MILHLLVKGKQKHTIEPVIDKLITHKNFSMVSRIGPLEESVVGGFYGGLIYGY